MASWARATSCSGFITKSPSIIPSRCCTCGKPTKSRRMYTRIFTLYIYNRLVQKSTRSNVRCTENSQIPHPCPPESFMNFHYILVQNHETPCFRNFPFKNRNIQTFFIFLQIDAPPYMATCPFFCVSEYFHPRRCLHFLHKFLCISPNSQRPYYRITSKPSRLVHLSY